jgi:hypothetical protein
MYMYLGRVKIRYEKIMKERQKEEERKREIYMEIN